MSTVTTLASLETRPALVKMPMSEEEYLALGETKHLEYHDGMCVVNPPTIRHQRAERRLGNLLERVLPEGFEIIAESGWRTGGSWFEPDLMVVPVESPQDVAVDAPLLVVEILSPPNRLDDILTKRDKYAAGRLPWYWIVDLDEPSVSVLELDDGRFVERQRLTATGTTVAPVEASIDPAALAESRR
jgi:Uma2 family endonuclease